MGNMNKDLAEDYLQGAGNFAWTAVRVCSSVLPNTSERIFRAEDPLNFLVGHAAELLLKSALASKGFLEKDFRKFNHDLNELITLCEGKGIVLDEDFLMWTKNIADNFKMHDFRYARTFAGIPQERQAYLESIQGTEEWQKEMRSLGLVVKSGVNFERYIKAIFRQMDIVNAANPN